MNHDIKLKEKIKLFLDGQLDALETDEMWAELLASSEDFEYLQTMASLKQMQRDGSLERILDENYEESVGKVLPLFSVEKSTGYLWGIKKYLVAASILIIGFAVLFQLIGDDLFISEQSPIAMIEFDIERSTEERNQTERDLQRAITYSVAGDLQAAFDVLNSFEENVELSDTERVNLMFVRGSIYYNIGSYDYAATLFERMISNATVTEKKDVEKSLWYLANAQVKMSQYPVAVQNIHRVIEMDGAFMRPAKGLLKSIENQEIPAEQ